VIAIAAIAATARSQSGAFREQGDEPQAAMAVE
jgi:hypothetical protein